MRKVVFFDRDDTIIYDKPYLNDPNLIEYIPGVFQAFQKLAPYYEFIMVTNQSGVARGLVEISNLREIHRRILQAFLDKDCPILDVYFDSSLPEENSPRRKPNPGMLIEAQNKYQIDMSQSWMIGDKESDFLAGKHAGCKSILIEFVAKKHDLKPSFSQWYEIADYILSHS